MPHPLNSKVCNQLNNQLIICQFLSIFSGQTVTINSKYFLLQLTARDINICQMLKLQTVASWWQKHLKKWHLRATAGMVKNTSGHF